MDLIETIYARRSIRKFLDKDVEPEKVETLLKLAMAAPSAMNRTPWEFYVISNQSLLDSILNSEFKVLRYQAPVAILVCGNQNHFLLEDKRDFWMQDCSAAVENILLGATSLGLGSVWCGITPAVKKVEFVKNLLSLDENIIPFALIYIGYPNEEKEPRTQYDENKVHYVK